MSAAPGSLTSPEDMARSVGNNDVTPVEKSGEQNNPANSRRIDSTKPTDLTRDEEESEESLTDAGHSLVSLSITPTIPEKSEEPSAAALRATTPPPPPPAAAAAAEETLPTPQAAKKQPRQRKQKQKQQQQQQQPPQQQPPAPPDPTMPPTPLLIVSLGNPPPTYTHTLHSAAHTLLSALAPLLSHPPFHKSAVLKGPASAPPPLSPYPWTLYQSPSYMNTSGPTVLRAYKAWVRTLAPSSPHQGRLVIVHDELERPLGSVSVRTAQGLSARGHNGLKSCLAALQGLEFVRVGVGIGRPESRGSEEVARYVLRKMSARERGAVEGAAGEVRDRLVALG